MHRIKIDNDILYASDGDVLSDVLMAAGKNVEHVCAGKGICQKCKVLVDGKEELSCKYKVRSDISVQRIDAYSIFSDSGIAESGVKSENMCYVLDIGTTTLAAALVSEDFKNVVKVITTTNPQRAYGADIMSRIQYCRENSAEILRKVLLNAISGLIENFGVSQELKLYVSGNATMLHIFWGVDCTTIGTAPYTPKFLEIKRESSFIPGVSEIESLPLIHSFVGADVVAGMYAAGLPKKEKYNLLVDLGTNAEVVLYGKSGGICTSAAAGPCFEGANISCGMSAVSGAISEAYVINGRLAIKTVDNTKAIGICGTGLIDIIAGLLHLGVIDESGYMDTDYILEDNIHITQGDVRQFQLAKSAIYSAVISLMREAGIVFGDIENFYISGGFSSKINIANAVTVGLVPKELRAKCSAINNSSLIGTVKYALLGDDLSIFTDKIEYVDLTQSKFFSTLFMENMYLR